MAVELQRIEFPAAAACVGEPRRKLRLCRGRADRQPGHRAREHLEGQFHENAKASQAADEELREVETGGVLYDFGAAAKHLARSIDKLHGEDEVPDAAVADAAGAIQPCSDRSAERRACLDEHGIE